ncbi:GGDEF domain-containing protein [Aquabacterium sp.]|uniref:GGDEF domain-containing protein n=1 Tax=Aquabacterium sp. TaxID=1872578 RepID=UPI003D6D0F15
MRSLGSVKTWLAEQLLDRRPVISCLLFSAGAISLLMVFVGLQTYALLDPRALTFYHPTALVAGQAFLVAVILGLGLVAHYCWGKRKTEVACNWLPVLTVTPTLVVLMGLAVAHGLKDTPISLAVLTAIMLGRALFDFRVLAPSLMIGAGMVLAHEVLVRLGMMSYAPLLIKPVFSGGELAWWWQIWCRVVLDFCLVSFLGMVLFLFATLGQRRRELETLVRTDMLTGLANRRTFMTQLEIESHRHARSKRPFSLVMCDVDHFKKINDTWGHPAGDAVLVALGRILKSTTREQIDTAARIGGEEFAVLLPETGLEQAQRVAQLMSSGVRAQVFSFDGQQFSVTQSVGVAQTNDGDGDAAMRLADDNLYIAKRQGRDRIVASIVQAAGQADSQVACSLK